MNRDVDQTTVVSDVATIFNRLYAPHGLSLVRSIRRHNPSARVWVVAVDDATEQLILGLEDSHIHVIPVSDIGDARLMRLQGERSASEFCWTVKPFVPEAVFDRATQAQSVVYLDADTWVLKPLDPILEEMNLSCADALVVRHDFSPEYDQTDASGEFAANILTFTRSAKEAILPRWQEQVLDWCGSLARPNAFGDQKYLEEWPHRYGSAVHVWSRDSLLGSPWNMPRRTPDELIAYNFHGLRLVDASHVLLANAYRLSPDVVSAIYDPYLHQLAESLRFMRQIGVEPEPSRPSDADPRSLRALALGLLSGRLDPKSGYLRELPTSRDL